MNIDHAARAQALVGARFRAQGRGDGGLDCVGVVIAVYELPADAVCSDYALRGHEPSHLKQELSRFFRRVRPADLRPGDVLLMQAAERQAHLGVLTEHGFVHAHAGLRRVVETPGLPEWPLVAAYRKRRSR